MWTCIGATAWLFFWMLFSSLAYASSLNIYRSGVAFRGGNDQDDAVLYVAQGDIEAPSEKSTLEPVEEQTISEPQYKTPAASSEEGPYDKKENTGPYDQAFEDAPAKNATGPSVESYY